MKNQVIEVEVEKLRKYLKVFNEKLSERDSDNSRSKLGQVLTIVDASFTDAVQRKAVKDLIQNNWYNNNLSAGNLFNPHTELRYLTETLGFELYPASEKLFTQPAAEYNRYTDIK